MIEACVLPLAAADALSWIRGTLNDAEMLRRPAGRDCAWLVNVPSQSSWRDAVVRILRLRATGAKFLVTQTGIDSVERHLLHAGATITLKLTRGDIVGHRFILMPTQFDLYFGRLARTVKF